MSGVSIDKNVVYLTLQELTTNSNNLSPVQRRLLLINLRLMLGHASLLLLNEVHRRNGLKQRHYVGMDKSKQQLIDALCYLKLPALKEDKWVLTQLGLDVIESTKTNIVSHMGWYISHERENSDEF